MIRPAAIAALVAGPALAEPRPLTGAEISALLPTIVAIGEDTRQTFSAAGATTYVDRGREIYGSWWVTDDRYCSRWPPADGFACFDMARDGDRLIWTGDSGHETINRLEAK